MQNPWPGKNVMLFDVETTGLDVENDQIVQIAMIAFSKDGRVTKKNHFIRPTIPIPAEATEIHGISDEDVKDAPHFSRFAAFYETVLQRSDVVVGYNVDFDINMLVNELVRTGKENPVTDQVVVCGLGMWRKLEPRNLEGAVKHFLGEEMEDAHDAMSDITYTLRVINAEIERHELSEATPEELQAIAFPDRGMWIGRTYHFQWNEDGQIVLGFGKKHIDTVLDPETMRGDKVTDIAGYMQWVIKKDFPPHVKEIAHIFIHHFPTFRKRVIEKFGEPPIIQPTEE